MLDNVSSEEAPGLDTESETHTGASPVADVSLFLPLVSYCAKQREEQVR